MFTKTNETNSQPDFLLQGLKKIQVLCLYNNKIRVIEQLDDQNNIEIFSIGNNLIEDRNCVSSFFKLLFMS